MSESFKSHLIQQIKSIVSSWANEAKFDLSLNKTSAAIETEEVLREFINKMYGLNYINANKIKQNMPGFDLIDEKNKKIIQISYNFSIDKVKTTLGKIKLKDYEITFIFPTNDNLEKIKQYKKYSLINNELKFDPSKNIKNLNDLYREMEFIDLDIVKKLHEFVSENLVILINPFTIQNKSNDLIKIINLLNSNKIDKIENDDFYINKKAFYINDKLAINDLTSEVSRIVHDYVVFLPKLKELFQNLEEIENNIIQGLYVKISKFYKKLSDEDIGGDNLFFGVINEIVNSILDLTNIDDSRLTFYITLIVCYVFWECEVFERP